MFFTQVIVLLTREEVENENLMGHVEDHIHLELAGNAMASVDHLANTLHHVLRLNNNRTRRIRYNGREIEPFTVRARRISFLHTLAEAAEVYRERTPAEPRTRTRAVHPDEADVGTITTVDMTDLDEVTPRQCERLVRRSLARNQQQAREPNDNDMQ